MIPARKPPPSDLKLPIWDIAAALLLMGAALLVVQNILLNLEAKGLQPGFAFLWSEAGFDVSEALIPYSPSDSYARVVLTGFLNTVFLSIVSLVFATLVGLGVGLLSVGPSPIGRALASGFVELFRNLPKLLLLLVFFVVAVNGLPPVREAISLGPIHLSNRSLYLPTIVLRAEQLWLVAALLAAGVGAWMLRRWADRRFEETGSRPRVRWITVVLVVVAPIAAAWALETPIDVSTPVYARFDFEGGARLSLQFVIVALTLALYHGAQIAEVIRGAIEATPKGQWEAAHSLGLNRSLTLRLIVVPQVARMVIPPMNNQYVNLIKNTSIAIAVGYSDLMSVAGTTINQTFRPLEMMLVTMGVYLALCLGVTSILNRWSEAIRRREGR